MSCLKPIFIDNRIFGKDARNTPSSFDKHSVSVPCGHCAGCRKRRKNDWFVRAYFEYSSYPQDCFFVTLDFDEEHLPRYNGYPCFDSVLLTNFFQALRRHLPTFRYMYSCDYGSLMERPHYHVIFFFPKNSVTLSSFFAQIEKDWIYGHYENVQQTKPRFKDPLQCVQYITNYTCKDLKYEVRRREASFPARYRFTTGASKFFGCQACDPSELQMAKMPENFHFLSHPVITRDFILSQKLLQLKLGDKYIPFSLPRFYEIKLMYNYRWDKVDKVSYLQKNQYGIELQKIRHNTYYSYVYEKFILSRSIPIHENKKVMETFFHLFPSSPYNHLRWSDIVDDVTLDSEQFKDFLKIYPYLHFHSDWPRYFGFHRYKPKQFHSCEYNWDYYIGSNPECGLILDYFDSSFDLFIHAMTLYKIYNDIENLAISDFEDYKTLESEKARCRDRIKNNKRLFFYLRRKHFNFNSLTSKPYVPHT